MQQRWMTLFMFVLLGNVIYFTACNVERLDEDLTLETIMERQADGCRLIITGHVANTEDLSRIEDVELDSDLFDEPVMTDEDGTFRIDLSFDSDEATETGEVEVTIDGFLAETIEVDFSRLLENCVFLTEVEWHIGLSPKKLAIGLSTTSPTTRTISDQYVVVTYEDNEALELVPVDSTVVQFSYEVTIPAVAAVNEPSICISPNHSFARGAGIVFDEEGQDLTLINFDVEASSNVNLNGAIEITFTTLLPISNGDIINVSNGSIINFDTESGMLTILVTTLDDIEVVNSFGCIINSFSATTGDQRSRQSLANCNCGDPQGFTFFDPFNPFTTLTIDMPENLDQIQQDLIVQELLNCLNIGIINDEDAASTIDFSSGIEVVADKCEVVTLSTRNIVRTYRGEILGIPFTYRDSSESETDLSTSNCPTDTACHQGCPG